LKSEEYVPGGMTSMLDAVGQSVSRLKNEVNDDENDVSFLVLIISDGEENNSREYDWNKVAAIMSEVKAKKNWTVNYVGANQDLSVVAKQMNLGGSNSLAWTTTSAGVSGAYLTMNSALGSYRLTRSINNAESMANFTYFTGGSATSAGTTDPNLNSTTTSN
jgi:hypothetical protein